MMYGFPLPGCLRGVSPCFIHLHPIFIPGHRFYCQSFHHHNSLCGPPPLENRPLANLIANCSSHGCRSPSFRKSKGSPYVVSAVIVFLPSKWNIYRRYTICLHIYIFTYIHTCIRTYVHTYIYIYIHIYVYIHIYIFFYICKYVISHIYIYLHQSDDQNLSNMYSTYLRRFHTCHVECTNTWRHGSAQDANEPGPPSPGFEPDRKGALVTRNRWFPPWYFTPLLRPHYVITYKYKCVYIYI